MIFLMMVCFSVSMVAASESNEEDVMQAQLAQQITAIVHERYTTFVAKIRKRSTSSAETISVEDFQNETIRINGGILPVSHEADKIAKLLLDKFFYEYEACDFFETYAQDNELNPTLKEKTLKLLSEKYENLYVQEEFLGSFSSQRLELASDQFRKEYNERIG